MVAATQLRSQCTLSIGLADERGILCNAVDEPEQCHFYYPAVVGRGPLQIAISTAGLSPSLAQRLRKESKHSSDRIRELGRVVWEECAGLMSAATTSRATRRASSRSPSREVFQIV